MITRTGYKYKAQVCKFVKVDKYHAELKPSAEFEFEFVGKPTDTEIRKEGKKQGVEIHKGYEIFVEPVEEFYIDMDDEFYLAHGTRRAK